MTKIRLTKLSLLVLCFFFLSEAKLWADNTPVKYGNVSENELNMKVYDKDTSAAAVILGEYGELRYEFSNMKRNYVQRISKNGRIKILNKDGLDYATIVISLFSNQNGSQRIGTFKGCTYNMVNGKIEKTKIGFGDRLEEKKSDHVTETKFTMKNVKEGSVIEYSYELESDFYWDIEDWVFQKSIPVVASELMMDIPDFVNFNFTQKGYLSFCKNEKEQFHTEFRYDFKEPSQRDASEMDHYAGSLPAEITRYKIGMKDIPAFRKEPYATASTNYRSCLNFHIASAKLFNGMTRSFAQTWDNVCAYLRENENFGAALKPNSWSKELSAQLSQGKSQAESLTAIYNFVRNNMKWDEVSSTTTKSKLEKAFKAKVGNSAEINLLLVSLLKQAGIVAYPVVLSTRDHGKVMPVHPTIDALNYVIAKATVDGSDYLLDATEKLTPIGILPERCLNEKGWVYKDLSLEEMEIAPIGSDKSTVSQQLSFADGKFKGKIQERRFEYSALSYRHALSNEKEEKWIEKLEKENNGLKINSVNFTNKDSLNKPLIALYDVEISDNADVTDKMIYFKPLFFEKKTKNIFESPQRLYPVEYPEAQSEVVNTLINVPEGYTIAELPKDTIISTGDKGGQFTYKVSVIGNTISIGSKIEIKKLMHLPTEYAELRKFYAEIVAKHQDQVVLKKI